MTYCVGLLIDEGLVMAADTRTNAGLDNVGKFKKLHTWAKEGERVFVLLTAGNLAVTQAVTSLLNEALEGKKAKTSPDSLFAAKTMFQAARIVGKAIREVRKLHGEHLGARGDAFTASFIFGGQIGKERPRLFQIYPEGNFIEATPDTPFFQIGEHKYGKPILDRVADAKMPLGEAAKMVLISFDSTLRSNMSVGLPIDMLTYENRTLKFEHVKRIGEDDPYFRLVSGEWSKALRGAFKNIPPFDI
jgi:putative proteasome-type protease